jgi:two-component system response regulator NreC
LLLLAAGGYPMRIVLISPEPVLCAGFAAVLAATDDLELAATAPDARSGFVAVDREKPDLVVVAVSLPGMSGVAATQEIRRRQPETRVLLLAPWARERDFLEGVAAGAAGLALTTTPLETLLSALRAVGAGRRFVPLELRGLVLEPALAAGAAHTDVLRSLSRREREVLDLIVKGTRSREIARELCVSIKTVETHRTHINQKLNCSSSADLVRFVAENGLLPAAPSMAAREPQVRTLVLFVESHTEALLGELLRELESVPADGPFRFEALAGGAPTAPELYGRLVGERPLDHAARILAFHDTPPSAGLRALAVLPDGRVTQGFLAAFERALARRRAPLAVCSA